MEDLQASVTQEFPILVMKAPIAAGQAIGYHTGDLCCEELSQVTCYVADLDASEVQIP